MDTKKYIASKLRELREDEKLKQDELGSMMDPPRGGATISSWETGRTTPDADAMLELCRIFGVEIIDFFPSDRPRPNISLSRDERDLIDNYRRATKEGKLAIEATARAMSRL